MKKIFDNKIIRIIITLLIIISMLIVPSIISTLLQFFKINNEIINQLLSLFIYSLLLILIFLPRLKIEFKIFVNNFSNSLDNGFKYWLLGLIIMIVSNIIINVIVFKGDIATNEELNRQAILNSPIYYTLLSTAVFAPFIEELVFRKNLETVFNNKLYYIITSGVLFGFMHVVVDLSNVLNLLYIIPYGALGAAFALMNIKTKTVFTSIMMHMLHNFITCSLLLLVL